MHGKIISAQEADKQFGPVINSISFNISKLLDLISGTQNSVMFKIIDNKIYILGDERKVLYPNPAEVKPDVVFHHFSKELVLQLINSNPDENVFIEKRENVLSVTCGADTLEWGVECPPFCI